MKISFTAVTAQHMLLLCVKTSRDNLNSAFGWLVLWCLFFDNKDAVGKTYPERTEWVFLQRLSSRLGCFWHTDICSRCFQLTVIMLKKKWTFFRISPTNIDVAVICSAWKGSRYPRSGRRGYKNWKALIWLKEVQVLVWRGTEETTFLSVSLYFLAFPLQWAFPCGQPRAPAEEGSLAPGTVPGDSSNATACPWCTAPGCLAQERH